ncbi:MAG: hypothetical protein V1858_01880 [Candidatus Gottesmanbacteria bacterium]
MSSRFGFSVIEEDSFTAIEKLKEENQKFGIVTNLAIFPEQIPTTEYFLGEAKDIIAPGGIIIVSIVDEQHREYLDKIKAKGIAGLTINIPEKEFGAAGIVILTAKKE